MNDIRIPDWQSRGRGFASRLSGSIKNTNTLLIFD